MDRPSIPAASDGTTSESAPSPARQIGPGPSTDDDAESEEDVVDHDPLRFHRWMRSSASGGILTGIALGLQHALEEKREVPAFVMEAPGEPDDPDAPIRLHFDPDDPTKTVAVVRRPPDPPDEGTRT